ncbi:MAG: monovalent cation:proton antiporter-2 (CPA2) family protein [Xanthomonadales bacterium]|jgi:glutathione-regulated potassium-efflux system protein KefB|nr:monovalent cation:proton antiporter-2 (CPA2) family protein [Xanthomonadales bacterium]
MISAYLFDIVILLLAAVVVVPLFQLVRLGAVPGFLVAGLIVGPSGLAAIGNVSEIGYLAEIGVVLLLFVIGIELKPSRLWLMRRQVFGLGSAQVLLTGAVLAIACFFLFGMSLRTAILVGPALALSSTAFVLQILASQKLLTSHYGRASVAVLLLQDLAVVPLLALIPLLAAPGMSVGADIGLALLESLAILALVVLAGRYFLHPLLHRVARAGSPEVFTASAVLIVLGAAMATEHAGLSMAMGAFLAGLLISESAYRHQVIAEIQPFRGLLLGLFFMSMGMSFNLGLLLSDPVGSIVLLALLIALKVLILLPLGRLFGLPWRSSVAVALLLAQSGEFALVLFALAWQNGLLGEQLFQELLLVVLLSMMVTPALAQLARRLVVEPRRPAAGNMDEQLHPNAPVVVVGFGRVGHRIGEILARAGQPFVALDSDPALIARARERGSPVYYGDMSNPGVLKSVGAADARVIVVTLNDPEASKDLVAAIREQYPQVEIFARGHNLETCQSLSRLGAAGVVSENVEASLELSRMAMERIGVDPALSEDVLSAFRRRYHAQIHEQVGMGSGLRPDSFRDIE